MIAVLAVLAAAVLKFGGGPSSNADATTGATKQQQAIDTGGQAQLAKLILPATMKIKGGKAPKLPFPSSGESIVAVSRLGTMGRSGGDAARPIASITKVMTAYVVLNDHPLKAGAGGPTITVSAAEAAAYPQQQAEHQSLVKVAAGEKITEYQALQALLIASGDNMAQILARWDAGSVPAFVAKMNKMARSLEMTKTRFVDPDGLSSQSVSNAEDLLELGSVALGEPVMVQIMGTRQATIPLNTITNYNTLLGTDGVFGIKTGSTTPAGGCLLFAAERTVAGKTYSIFGAVLGAPGTRATILRNAMEESKELIEAAAPVLRPVTLIKAGTPVATVRNAAGQTSTYAVTKDVVVNGWKGLAWHLRLSSSLKPGQGPGQVIVKASTGRLTIPLSRVAAKKK